MRVVFDTNILISVAFWRGAPYRSLLAVQAGLADLVLSPPILAELNRVLLEKFQFSEAEAQEVVSLARSCATLVEIPDTLRVVPDDPDDDKFIETAQVAGAPLIVSGDTHLLRLRSYQGIDIITARAFLDKLNPPAQ